MSTKPDGGPAFPVSHEFVAPGATVEEMRAACGMSLRDYYAGLALSGSLGSDAFNAAIAPTARKLSMGAAETWAAHAYEIADAMLAERAKST